MRTPPPLDDDLIEHASQLADPATRPELLETALRELIQREAARELAAMGGSQPQLRLPAGPRRGR